MAAWSLWQTMKENSGAKIAITSRFWLAAYIIWLFDPLFSLVYFSRLKNLLVCQILQNVAQRPDKVIVMLILQIWDRDRKLIYNRPETNVSCMWRPKVEYTVHWTRCQYLRYVTKINTQLDTFGTFCHVSWVLTSKKVDLQAKVLLVMQLCNQILVIKQCQSIKLLYIQ